MLYIGDDTVENRKRHLKRGRKSIPSMVAEPRPANSLSHEATIVGKELAFTENTARLKLQALFVRARTLKATKILFPLGGIHFTSL